MRHRSLFLRHLPGWIYIRRTVELSHQTYRTIEFPRVWSVHSIGILEPGNLAQVAVEVIGYNAAMVLREDVRLSLDGI